MAYAAAGCSSGSSGEEEDAADARRAPVRDIGPAPTTDASSDALDTTMAADTVTDSAADAALDAAADAPSDAGSDVALDADPDAPPDGDADAAPDAPADVVPDVEADAPADTTPDAEEDATPDVEPDAAPDMGTDASPDAPTSTPLDPNLSTPPASNSPCTIPGASFECGPLEICRHFSAEESRCESCDDGTCNGLNQPCASSSECDILFTCYFGRCTGTCDLTTPQVCGNPSDCTNVGHPTHGVCMPR